MHYMGQTTVYEMIPGEITASSQVSARTGVHHDVIEAAWYIMREVNNLYGRKLFHLRTDVEKIFDKYRSQLAQEDPAMPDAVYRFLFDFPRESGVIHSDAPPEITIDNVNGEGESFIYKDPESGGTYMISESGKYTLMHAGDTGTSSGLPGVKTSSMTLPLILGVGGILAAYFMFKK